MSIEAMNWAWKQKLVPTVKLVLMALADYADEQGECFPSVDTLADKCTVNKRTVQRTLRELETNFYLHVIPRFVGGFQVSSRYKLNLQLGSDYLSSPRKSKRPSGGDKLSPHYKSEQAGPKTMVDKGAGVTTRGDMSVTQTTNSILCINHQLLQFLKAAEKQEIEKLLKEVPDEDAAWLILELVGIQKMNGVRNAIGLMKKLIERYSIGEFVPSLGITIADQLRHEVDIDRCSGMPKYQPKSGRWNSKEENAVHSKKLKLAVIGLPYRTSSE